ncbi:MAG: TraR/DksA family transcriptional regulator [Chloroflexia bacterium]
MAGTRSTEDTIEGRLLRERAELKRAIRRLELLTEQLRSDRGGGDGGVSNHMAEGASSTFDQERNLALLGNLRRTLEQVEAALRRLSAGTYGLCEVCGEPIDRARLEALPYAAQCVNCQRRLERG